MINILFIDENTVLLDEYKKFISKHQDSWTGYFVSDGNATAQYLKYANIDVIVTDIYMPNIGGLKILDYARRKKPNIIRIIVSSATDMYHKMDIIKLAHRYLTKPTQMIEILNSINEIYFYHKRFINDKTRKLLSSINSIPAAPITYNRLLKLLNSKDYSLKDVGNLISQDPGMSITILKIVNSGISNKVTSPALAVSLLGIDMVKHLVLNAEIFNAFPINSEFDFNLDYYMKHSILCADFMRAILIKESSTNILDKGYIELGYLSGMLHNIGQLIFASTLPRVYNDILNKSKLNGVTVWELEKKILGSSHGRLGAYILGVWGFDRMLIEAIAFHHNPIQATEKDSLILVALHVANIIAHELLSENHKGKVDNINLDLIKLNSYSSKKIDMWYEICKNLALEKNHEKIINC